MDDKDKLKRNSLEVPFEGTIEIDPSSIEIEDDGSMSEPSFNSEEVLDDNDFDIDNEELQPSRFAGDEVDNYSDEELIDDDLDEELIDDDLEDISSDEQFSDDNISDSNQEVSESSTTNDSTDEKVQSDDSKDNKKSEDNESTSDNSESTESSDNSNEETSSSSDNDDSSTSEDSSSSSDGEETSSSDDSSNTSESTNDNSSDNSESTESTDSAKDESSDNISNDVDDKQSGSSDNKNVDSKEPTNNKPEDTKDVPDKKTPEAPDAKDAAKEAAKEQANDAKEAAKEAAKDTAKDTAKEAAKDTAKDAAKDVAKDAAKEGAKEGAKNAAKNSVGDKVAIASDTKDALSKGPKGLVGAPGIRAALTASANTNPYSKAGAIAVKVLDTIFGKDKTDWLLDKLGEGVIKTTIFVLVMSFIQALLPIFLFIIAIFLIFAPLLDAIMEFDLALRKVADTAEKFKNLYINHRFGDSKEVFYAELDTLGNIYGEQLDETLLLATTFYPDMKDGYKNRYDNLGDIVIDSLSDEENDSLIATFIDICSKEIDSLIEEADSTYDKKTGLVYSTGKVYRLRSLASHMFSEDFLGSADDYVGKEVSLGEWLDEYGQKLWDTLWDYLSSIIVDLATDALGFVVGTALMDAGVTLMIAGGPGGKVAGFFLTLAGGLVNIFTAEETARDLVDAISDLKVLINCAFLGYMSIKDIDFDDVELDDLNDPESLLDKITLTLYDYKFSEENYRAYLKEEYIPNMPDFEKYLSYDSNGNPKESSIDRIINEIFDYKKYFEKLFYAEDIDYSESYSQLCLGAIDKKLAAAMSAPVDINTDNCIDFSGKNGFGYTEDGLLHNGIELNANSTGSQAGDKVYSVMDNGTVIHSSYDNTMECVGGCLEIEYDNTTDEDVDKNTYHYSIVYKGLSKNSVTLKTGDTVTNRQQVGVIGTAEESENMGLPSLYIEFRNSEGTAIDPTNMIIKCSSPGTADYPDAKTVEVPQTFKQAPFYEFTCYGGNGYYVVGCKNPNKSWDNGTGQLRVYNIWKEQGGRYKHDIAVVTVDGVERYVAAVVLKAGSAGDIVNAKLADGSVIPLIIGDSKSHGSSPDGWGNSTGHGTDLIEFEVDKQAFRPDDDKGYKRGREKWTDIEWDQTSPVVSFSNAGNIKSGKFDTTTLTTSDNTSTSSNGLVACASMSTGGGSSISNPTESIPIHETLISKTDFITATQKYKNSVSCIRDCNTFLSQASDIYDISKKYNVNPELVVVRAIKEGYSPGSSKNNYWGIGCVNQHPEKCKSYSSLDEGIKNFATKTVVKDSNTCAEMMSKYAYIGDYWFNPGSWSDGGCKYFSYIKPYLQSSQDRISQIESACRSGNTCSGSSCLATDDNDQLAYGQYQCVGMNQLYKKIYLSYH